MGQPNCTYQCSTYNFVYGEHGDGPIHLWGQNNVTGDFWIQLVKVRAVSKSHQLHVAIFQLFLNHFKVNCINSSKMINNSLEISKLNQLFLKNQPVNM